MLEGRIAVVTGGAGAIGGAMCKTFAAHGADVIVTDIDADRTAAVVDAVHRQGRQAIGFVADLTEDGAVDELHRRALDTFGHVDVLVNGLGHHLGTMGPFLGSNEQQWDDLYRVNFLHVLRACKAFVPGMQERGWGRVINFSSVEGIRAMPNHSVYTAFKGALNSFTRSLAVDLAGGGINVNCIAVDRTKSYQVNFYDMPPEYDRMVPVWVPAGRNADAEEVASVALFLASEMASFVIGQTIAVDGGTLAAGGWYRTKTRWTASPLLLQYFEDDPDVNATRPPALQ